jgi:hypothetical protein
MKAAIMKCSILLLLIPFFNIAVQAEKSEAERRIQKEFAVTTDGSLAVENRYGKIDIAIGETNQIKMEVVIKVRAGSDKKAQEGLDRISIDLAQSGNRVSASTNVSSTSGWSSWFDNGNVEMEINYNILVPADIFLDLRQKYGSIFVETTNRDLRIDLSYGDLRLGDINAKLSLEMAYSDGNMSRINSGDLLLSYSDLEMEDADAVKIDMKYTDLVMGSAQRASVTTAYSDFRAIDIYDLTYRGKYDDVSVERVRTIDMESAYSGMRIGGLSSHGRFDMRYGELQVSNIASGFTRVDINTSYTGVKLRFLPGASFTVDAQNNYCPVNHHDLRVSEDIQKAGSVILKASRGTGGGLITARMNYGELSIE